MTNRLDRLEDLRLIMRRPDQNDRRGLLIQLTPKGLQVVEAITPALLETERNLVSSFGNANVEQLTRLLISFSQHLVDGAATSRGHD
jgi:DNA-binding MarR family transcriptional regulator